MPALAARVHGSKIRGSMSALRKFLDANRAACAALDRVWPYPLASTFWESYVQDAASLAQNAVPPRIVDVGAGKETPYAALLPSNGTQLIGVDVLADDMEENPALSERLVADLVQDGFPEAAKGAGLITSRMVLEHIPDQRKFARELYDALAPGAQTIHLFAARYSLFATLNRMLPEAASRRILFALRPESVEVGGFETYYDRTNAPAAESVFREAGLEIVRTEVSYQVSQYFHFFFPAFLLARIWETALHVTGRRNLGAFVKLVARRPVAA